MEHIQYIHVKIKKNDNNDGHNKNQQIITVNIITILYSNTNINDRQIIQNKDNNKEKK